MLYALITNPVSGELTVDQKRAVLAEPAKILNAKIHGLDTRSAIEFRQLAQKLTTHCDVLVVAGGDGTFSDIINSIDTVQTAIAYLPLGTGNAMQYALNYKGTLADIANRIKRGRIHEFDLINCDNIKRAFMVSVGIEGTIIQLRNAYLTKGHTGFKTYFRSALNAYRKEYKRVNATVTIDDHVFEVARLLSIMVVKQPYYGFGMNVVPKARFNDRKLHILSITSGLLKSSIGGVTAFTIGNRIGEYRTGRRVILHLEQPLVLQIDGNEAWESETFRFTLLPKALKIKW
ncbi:MAG: NAD(+)/NADH kinase [Candidatus Marinimicrobia bacterium]|nr:NAD(+)/NADH kinase [Candidatus Neomarinimicrobiota bacterium]